jgi:replicative DNA helicase
MSAARRILSEQTEGRLFRLAEAGDTGGGVQTLYEALRQAAASAQLAFHHDGGVTGVTTGLANLDRRLGGLQPSDLIIHAGRPGMGPIGVETLSFNPELTRFTDF